MRKGETIISPDQPCTAVYLVYSGRVERIPGEDGREIVVDEYRPRDVFGLEAFISRSSRLPAIAAEHSVIKSIALKAFERLMRH